MQSAKAIGDAAGGTDTDWANCRENDAPTLTSSGTKSRSGITRVHDLPRCYARRLARRSRPAVRVRILAEEGFVHCSPDEAVTLAVVNAFYRDTPRSAHGAAHRRTQARRHSPLGGRLPGASSGVAPGTLFPHVYGRINRDAVEGMMEVHRDADGRAVELAVWS